MKNRLPVLLFLSAVPCIAELPDAYKHVDRVLFVVEDVDGAVAGWKKVGAIDAANAGEYRLKLQHRGKEQQARLRWATANFAGVTADFVQPLTGDTAFSEFKKQHRAGVLSLIHRMSTAGALNAEIARLKSLGVSVLESGSFPDDETSRFVLFDTAPEGKYALGLAYYTKTPPLSSEARKIVQYAFVARDLEAVSRYWAKLGIPVMSFTHPVLWDLKYHDRPGDFDAQLGWQRHGTVVYEWIKPLKGPTTYSDHMEVYGEGLHHIAFDTKDIDAESAEWTRKGFPFEQGGAWGERDRPGYGRFAYQDMHAVSGIDIELLWNYKPAAAAQ
jgi:hypothetical protein